jgi:MYXO-CTERM domain-containing protein
VTTGWSFIDTLGGNNLSGTFWLDDDNGIKAYYDITGGSGLFAGATGSGSSVISVTKWYADLGQFFAGEYHEKGNMTVDTPTAVAEPSTTALAVVGLALVGFAAFRRRRVDVTRG